jgi:hypothetical protein
MQGREPPSIKKILIYIAVIILIMIIFARLRPPTDVGRVSIPAPSGREWVIRQRTP